MLFDEPYYIRINEARWDAVVRILHGVRTAGGLQLRTCLDVGSGPGWFSEKLKTQELAVEGLEGRPQLAEEARRRNPGVRIHVANIESELEVAGLGSYDLVFCFGLLYHTENPYRVIRNLRQLTGGLLLIESILIPVESPCAWLVREDQNETQGLTHQSLIPTRSCLLGMLHAAGFPYAYEFTGDVDHEDFRETADRHRRRRIFLCSEIALAVADCERAVATPTPKFDFTKTHGRECS